MANSFEQTTNKSLYNYDILILKIADVQSHLVHRCNLIKTRPNLFWRLTSNIYYGKNRAWIWVCSSSTNQCNLYLQHFFSVQGLQEWRGRLSHPAGPVTLRPVTRQFSSSTLTQKFKDAPLTYTKSNGIAAREMNYVITAISGKTEQADYAIILFGETLSSKEKKRAVHLAVDWRAEYRPGHPKSAYWPWKGRHGIAALYIFHPKTGLTKLKSGI